MTDTRYDYFTFRVGYEYRTGDEHIPPPPAGATVTLITEEGVWRNEMTYGTLSSHFSLKAGDKGVVLSTAQMSPNTVQGVRQRGPGAFLLQRESRVDGRAGQTGTQGNYIFGGISYRLDALPNGESQMVVPIERPLTIDYTQNQEPSMATNPRSLLLSVDTATVIDGVVGQVLLDDVIVWQGQPVAAEDFNDDLEEAEEQARKQAVKTLENGLADLLKTREDG